MPNVERTSFTIDDKKVRLASEVTVQSIIDSLVSVDKSLLTFTIDPAVDMIYLLGYTGAGKSTLLNYLIDGDMDYEKKNGKFLFKNRQDPESKFFPSIGNGLDSETMLPRSFTLSSENISFVDTPGFMSTSGPIQEISDSYANSKIFKKGNKVKIVLVLEENTLFSGRGEFLIKAAKKISEMFPVDSEYIFSSSSIVVTKVELSQITLEDIYSTLEEISQSRKSKYPEVSFMLKNILKNKHVYVLPNPSTPQMNDHVESIKVGLKKQDSYALKNDAEFELSP